MCSTDVLLPDATLSAVQAAVTALAGSRIVLHATDRGWAERREPPTAQARVGISYGIGCGGCCSSPRPMHSPVF